MALDDMIETDHLVFVVPATHSVSEAFNKEEHFFSHWQFLLENVLLKIFISACQKTRLINCLNGISM